MPLNGADRRWFLSEIERLDPEGRIVTANDERVRYSEVIRSDETRDRKADSEELVRALTLCLLCGEEYGYETERMYIEQTHTIGRPGSTAQVDLVLYFLEEENTETVFAMWEMKAPDEYKPDTDGLIEEQLFKTAPILAPSLLVYSTIVPRRLEIECITIDYKAHKSYAGWVGAGRPST